MLYLASDYSATGEGSTRCFLITQAMPNIDDYFKETLYTNDPKTKNTPLQRAYREFEEVFGNFYTMGLKEYNQETFFYLFDVYIPQSVKNICLYNKGRIPAFVWHSKIHTNYS